MKKVIATLTLTGLLVVGAAAGCGPGSSGEPTPGSQNGPAGVTPGPLTNTPGTSANPGQTFPSSSNGPAYSMVP